MNDHLWGALFLLAILIYYVAGPLRRIEKEIKRQAIIDEALSRHELCEQRRGQARVRGLTLDGRVVLEVPADASQTEIDRAWRRQARHFQPEGGGNIFCFWLALDAYETLSGRKETRSDYCRYLDAYLSAWLAISNKFRSVWVPLHGIILIWAVPLFVLGGMAYVGSAWAGWKPIPLLSKLAWAIPAAGLWIMAPYIPGARVVGIRLQDWFSRWRANRQMAAWDVPNQASNEYPSQRLHQLVWRAKKLDKLALDIALYRYGIWLTITVQMAVAMVLSLIWGLPIRQNGQLWELWLGFGLAMVFFGLVCWRISQVSPKVEQFG